MEEKQNKEQAKMAVISESRYLNGLDRMPERDNLAAIELDNLYFFDLVITLSEDGSSSAET